MDKQLIERMKAEVRAEMRSMFSPSVESFIDAYTDRLLARIDAERGKGAHAWEDVDRFYSKDDPELSGHIRETATPLFLSPTIPEGMALVKKAVLRDRGFVYTPGNVSGAAIPIVTVQFDLNDWDSRDAFAEAMLDAEGERNAD